MANPLFEALNGNRMAGMLEQFQQFRKEMEGRNPNEEINRLLQSGKINQQQLNQAQQMAQQMQKMAAIIDQQNGTNVSEAAGAAAQQMQGMFKGFFK